MEEVIEICNDLSFPDKGFIIQKYLLKYLKNKNLSELEPELITDIFNSLSKEDVEEFKEQIEDIIGEFNLEEFTEIKWKIGNCFNCSELGSVERCKKEHIDECEYEEITEPEGCRNLFCDDCIFHRCSNQNDECPVVRCENCSNS